ncbi:response regulator transcription factor [Lapidilactobacillus achengensis]|uniref:Response regulator transcription factor n=1 Tax=Lapidilactobacillus achengensis TaxID=2486000 RepID=A0ABW1UR90_9LACO|nr:response regulator transcription factor [Lapidilactobacillus achengensis]
MVKILVVDDEVAIQQLISYNLEQVGYQVATAGDGASAYQLAVAEEFDCIVLDLMLPKMDGIEVTKRLRQAEVQTPIIMLTARHEEADKIIGLELGADDYMTKPFSPRELLARIKAIRRRVQVTTAPLTGDEVVFAETTWQTGESFVIRAGERLHLTRKEFELLTYLVQHRGKVISRQQIMTNVWQTHEAIMSRMVDMQISHLRDKIEPDPKHPTFLLTVRGFGYRLEVTKVEA